MSVNFCLPCYNPTVSCNNVSADGYEVNNLISSDFHALKRGFRAEYFIKPPVEIIVSFSIPVEISHVALGLKVGEQQTSGFEIWTQFIKKDLHELEENEDFQIVAQKYDVTVHTLSIKNLNYKPRGPLAHSPLPSMSSEMTIDAFQGNNMRGTLTSVGRLKVRLTRTLGSSVPALSFLQVWGQPSRNCKLPITLHGYTSKSFTKMASPVEFSKDKDKMESSSSLNLKGMTALDQKDALAVDLDIPSEFIDPITCELMILPFMLPSGHSIDQVTLEKCNNSQIAWGHLPNDPFTGIPYNSDHQPIFNSSLKTRIDKYLLEHGHLLKVPRTVGRKKTSSQILQPNLGLLKHEKQTESFRGITEKTNICTENCLQSSSCKSNLTRRLEKRTSNLEEKSVENAGHCKFKRLKFASSDSEDSILSENDICNKQGVTLQEISHEEQLASSLSSAIKNTLKCLKSFSKPSVPLIQTVPKCVTSDCHGSTSIYCLPCSHIFCRDCLAKSKSCSLCKTSFLSSDVIRIYK